MALTEKDLEKKSLSDITALVYGYEQKSKDFASKVGAGIAKPADMIALNSDLALLKKVLDKKSKEQSRLIPRGQSKKSAPLKSFDDYVKSKGHK